MNSFLKVGSKVEQFARENNMNETELNEKIHNLIYDGYQQVGEYAESLVVSKMPNKGSSD